MSLRIRIQQHGTMEGTAEEWIAESKPRALEAVIWAMYQLHIEIGRSLARRSVGPATPGAPPRTLTGEIRRLAAKRRKVRVAKYTVTGTFWIRHPAVNRLEFGGVDKKGRRTFPHPFVRPAFEKIKAAVEKRFREV
jgi:hypothetical protein